MALLIYTIVVVLVAGTLGFLFGSAVEKDIYKYYDALGKLAAEDYEKVIALLRKVREDI